MTTHLTARIGTAALSLVAAVAGIGLAAPGAIASADQGRSTSHTETFVSHDLGDVRIGKSHTYADFSRDVQGSTVIGADASSGTFDPATGRVTGVVTLLRKQGLMTGTFTLDTRSGVLSGSIVSGEGKYRGAHGSVTGHAVSEKVVDVTVSYRN